MAKPTKQQVEVWDQAMAALDGAKIIGLDWGEMHEAGRIGESWTLYLEGGGAVELGAIPVRDVHQPFEHGVTLVATHLPHMERPT